jgi:hypothetical protein
MNSLANTTWTFSTQDALAGTIQFQQVGPSPNSGVATITPTNPPAGFNVGTYQAQWAQSADGKNFAVQFSDFMTDPSGFNPPPLAVPTINAGTINMQPVTLFGSMTGNGKANMCGTNFGTRTALNAHVVGTFTMTQNH